MKPGDGNPNPHLYPPEPVVGKKVPVQHTSSVSTCSVVFVPVAKENLVGYISKYETEPNPI